MAPRYAPFEIVITYSGVESTKEVNQIYSDFYIDHVKSNLIDSNLSDVDKKEVITRLIHYHSQSDRET